MNSTNTFNVAMLAEFPIHRIRPTTAAAISTLIISSPDHHDLALDIRQACFQDEKLSDFNSYKETTMKKRLFTLLVLALPVIGLGIKALAQDDHSQNMTQENQEQTPDEQSRQSALLKIVRQWTERFQNVKVAEREGYRLEFGCVSGDDFGAMGLHYVNDTLVGHGIVDVTRPQIILYEAQPNGRLKLTGADYLILAEAWDAKHPGVTPQLMGQIFHYFPSPNRFGLPAFYTLHVWAWKENPKGAFVNWHPNVSCQSFVGKTTP